MIISSNILTEFDTLVQKYFPIKISRTPVGVRLRSLEEPNYLHALFIFNPHKGKYKFRFHFNKTFSIITQYYFHKFKTGEEESSFNYKLAGNVNLFSPYDYSSSFEGIDIEFTLNEYAVSKSRKSMRELYTKFEKEFHTVILPGIERLSNVHFLDKMINSKIDFGLDDGLMKLSNNLHLDRMIVAKYANNPNYEEICKYIFGYLDQRLIDFPRQESDIIKTKKMYKVIYDRLKTVEQLEDPNLNNYEIDYELEPVCFDEEEGI